MVEVKTKPKIDMPRRAQIAQDRMRARTAHLKGIRVLPKNDDVRKYIKHMPSGLAFRSEGSIEWPNDKFTQRRIADGTVIVVKPEEKTQGRPARPQQPPPVRHHQAPARHHHRTSSDE